MKRLIKDGRKHRLDEPATRFAGYGFREKFYAEESVEKTGEEYTARFCAFLDIVEDRDFLVDLRDQGIEGAVQRIIPAVISVNSYTKSRGQYDMGTNVRFQGVMSITKEEFDRVVAQEKHDRKLEQESEPLRKKRSSLEAHLDVLRTELDIVNNKIAGFDRKMLGTTKAP